MAFNLLSGTGINTQLVVESRDFNQRGVIKIFAEQSFRIIMSMCLHDKELIGSDLKEDLTKIQGVVAALQGNTDGLPPSEQHKLRVELGNSLIDPASILELLTNKGNIELGQYL